MSRELIALLRPLYEHKIWWFTPDASFVQRSTGGYDYVEREKRNRGNVVVWIAQAAHPPIGSERKNRQWSAWGKWDTSHTFPEAVAWLREKVRSLMTQATEDEAYWSAEAKKLEERKESLYRQYYVPIHHKEYVGEQPVTEERVRYVGERWTRYGSEPIMQTKDIQWYDLMEELDETPAQRRDEIANELANPKQQFTAWCKLGTQEHIVRIEPFGEPDADAVWMARRNQIIEHTRHTYCQSRTCVEEEITTRQNRLMRKEPPKASTTSDDEEG